MTVGGRRVATALRHGAGRPTFAPIWSISGPARSNPVRPASLPSETDSWPLPATGDRRPPSPPPGRRNQLQPCPDPDTLHPASIQH